MLRSRMEFAPSGTQGRVPRGAPGAAPSRTRPAIAPKTGAGAGARHSEDVAVGLAAVGEREARDGHVELGARRLGEGARREAELAAEGAHAAAAAHRLVDEGALALLPPAHCGGVLRLAVVAVAAVAQQRVAADHAVAVHLDRGV